MKRHQPKKHHPFIYLFYGILVVFLVSQLMITLYQVGKSITYQAKLAQLNHKYQILSKEKTDLSVSYSQKLNLRLATARAKELGYVKLKATALNQEKEKVALLP